MIAFFVILYAITLITVLKLTSSRYRREFHAGILAERKREFLRVLDLGVARIGHRGVAQVLDVSIPTVKRWSERLNLPHPAMQLPATDLIRDAIAEDEQKPQS